MQAGQPPAATVSVALFASGSGSNVAALLEHRYRGAVRPCYRCLIGNNSGARAMAWAREHGVSAYHVSRHTHPQRDACLARLEEILTAHRIELIVLAGYMKLLPVAIVRRWRGRILNIHPALLPRHGGRGMYGLAPHRAVLAAGERETGVTVHLVDEQYDGGPIVMQRTVPVRAGDTPETLARRVLAAEHDTYWRAVEQAAAALANGRARGAAGTAPTAPAGPAGRRGSSGQPDEVRGGRPPAPVSRPPTSGVPAVLPGTGPVAFGDRQDGRRRDRRRGRAPAAAGGQPAEQDAAAAPCGSEPPEQDAADTRGGSAPGRPEAGVAIRGMARRATGAGTA